MHDDPDEEMILPKMTAGQWDELLRVAGERMDAENEVMRQKNDALRAAIERYRAYAARLEATLAELQEEQNRIDTEVRRLLSPEDLADFPLLAAKLLAAK